jgi:Flp pilus assembly protein TadD
MTTAWETELTPEAARKLLSGATPLRELMGVPMEELMAMTHRAHHLWRQGRREDAVKLYKGLVALDEGVSWGHAGLGLAAMEAGEYGEAEGHLLKARAADGADPSIQVNLAECWLHLDRLTEALGLLSEMVSKEEDRSHPGTVRAAAILMGIGQGLGVGQA